MSDGVAAALAVTDAEASAALAAAVGSALLLTGAALLPLAGYLGSRVVPERRVFFARWGGRHFVLVLASFVATLIAVMIFAPFLGVDPDDLLAQLSVTLVLQAVPAVVAWRCARATEPDAVVSFGLQREKSGAAVAYGVFLYVLFLPAIYGAGLVWPWCLEALGETPEPQAVLVNFAGVQGGRLVVALLLATLVVPFLEEFLFRGFLQPFLVQNFHDRGGVVLTAFFFALLHGTSAFLPVFALGLLLGGVALKTRRLYASWAIHALHNGSMLTIFLLNPELATPPGGWLAFVMP